MRKFHTFDREKDISRREERSPFIQKRTKRASSPGGRERKTETSRVRNFTFERRTRQKRLGRIKVGITGGLMPPSRPVDEGTLGSLAVEALRKIASQTLTGSNGLSGGYSPIRNSGVRLLSFAGLYLEHFEANKRSRASILEVRSQTLLFHSCHRLRSRTRKFPGKNTHRSFSDRISNGRGNVPRPLSVLPACPPPLSFSLSSSSRLPDPPNLSE